MFAFSVVFSWSLFVAFNPESVGETTGLKKGNYFLDSPFILEHRNLSLPVYAFDLAALGLS